MAERKAVRTLGQPATRSNAAHPETSAASASAMASRQARVRKMFAGSPMAFLLDGQPEVVIAHTRRGLPAQCLDFLAGWLEIPRAKMLNVVQIKPSTAERRIRNGQRLSQDESDRLVRIGKATQRAVEVFEDEDDAKAWVKRPALSLGQVSPLSLLDTQEGYALVMDTLGRIEYGVYG